jgi:transcriptional regulator with XRE-family HTH domain
MRERIAEEVRSLMGRRRMRDIELARLLGRSHTYMYRRLSGETAFDADDLELIARALDVKIVDLLPRDEREVTVREPSGRVTAGLPATGPRSLPWSPLAAKYPSAGRPPTRPGGIAPSSRRSSLTGH